MEIIKPTSLSEIFKNIEDIRKQYSTHEQKYHSGRTLTKEIEILYRGVSDSDYSLKTTLERKSSKEYSVTAYIRVALQGLKKIEAFTGKNWEIKSTSEILKDINAGGDHFDVHLPCYDYLVYLRHHGFPSPLLDWTESPFIALFFAYATSLPGIDAAVFCYIEKPESYKEKTGGKPQISMQTSYVNTHKRHFAQKAKYTISTVFSLESREHIFCPHEKVFSKDNPTQDILYKIILPAKFRTDVLKTLNDNNIDFFTLFHDEDSLIKSIAWNCFDL